MILTVNIDDNQIIEVYTALDNFRRFYFLFYKPNQTSQNQSLLADLKTTQLGQIIERKQHVEIFIVE